MYHHANALILAAFVLGLLLLPALRWVDVAWLAMLSKIFESRGTFPDEEDEDDYRLFVSASEARNEPSPRNEMSETGKPRVTPR